MFYKEIIEYVPDNILRTSILQSSDTFNQMTFMSDMALYS